jgi:hypothetical protein
VLGRHLPSTAELRSQPECILASSDFAASSRQQDVLFLVVEATLGDVE